MATIYWCFSFGFIPTPAGSAKTMLSGMQYDMTDHMIDNRLLCPTSTADADGTMMVYCTVASVGPRPRTKFRR